MFISAPRGEKFLLSYRYKAPPTTKKPFFAVEHRPTRSGTQDNRQPRQAFAPYLIGRAPTQRGSVSAVPLCLVCLPNRRQMKSGTEDKQSSGGGLCRSVFQCAPPFAVGISPIIEKLCKGTAFFAHTQARAEKKHKKALFVCFCTIFPCRTCRFARKSPI